MRVSEARLDAWRVEVSAAASDARLSVAAELEAWASSHPGASVEQHREAAIRAVSAASSSYGRVSSSCSASLFDELAEAQGSPARFRVADTTDRAYVEEKVRWLAGRLRRGDADGFRRGAVDLAAAQVMRNAQASMAANCERAGARWARVPHGPRPCEWCFMLASRGFAYKTARTASAGGHMRCLCALVPDFDGKTAVEGYDPDGMYARWRMCAETVGRDPADTSEEAVKAILDECATRDRHWLKTGEVPEPTFATDALRAEVERERPHEIVTAGRLKLHGIRCDFVDDSAGLADFADGVEIKTLGECSSYNTLNGYIKGTSKKKNAVRLIFDNAGNTGADDGEIEQMIRRSQSFSRGGVYILRKDGTLKKIR